MHTIVILAIITLLSFTAWLVPAKTAMEIQVRDYEADLQRYHQILEAIQHDDYFELYQNDEISLEEFQQANKADIKQISDLIIDISNINPPPEYKDKYIKIFDLMRHYKSYLLFGLEYVDLDDDKIREERYAFMQTHKQLGVN